VSTNAKRRICVVTGSRAEYGLLYWLLRELRADPFFELQLAVTGMHLSPEFGLTWKLIEADGFPIDAKVEILLSSDSPAAVSKSMGLAMIGFADAFARLRPELLVVLGDRFEILSAVSAAAVARIPVAHLHGGETTEGAFDEGFRHAVTKMSHLHFASTEQHRGRIIQMGEAPEKAFNVGAIGLDALAGLELLDRERLQRALEFEFRERNMLVTFHPATLEDATAEAQFRELLLALDAYADAGIIFTKANADTDGRAINRLIDTYAAAHPGRVAAFASLGQLKYLSTFRCADVVLGNSSSGIIEAPSFGVPTVNVGNRQRGRTRAASVIDCAPTADAIGRALDQALSTDFRKEIEGMENPYGNGGTARRIIDVLRRPLAQDILFKRFHDLPRL
jgi:GDP/UDP-N,N'-diacetylbacillosamine 2-epimerase (hydrolysing)